MIKRALLISLTACAAFAQAGEVTVNRNQYGSGQPNVSGVESAQTVENNVLHGPQYLPGFPTSATIWPRVVEVPCVAKGAELVCDGYQWTPSLGRAEYLYFVPKIVEPTKPVTERVEVPVPVIVYKEVPVKPGKQ